MYRAPPELACRRCGAAVRPNRRLPICAECGADIESEVDGTNGGAPGLAAGEELVAELRQAFELHAEGLSYSGSCWLGKDGGNDAALAGSVPNPALPSGARLGDYRVDAEIGRGGMGIVYRAHQVSLNRPVALKVLPNYARHSPPARERFLAESRAAARIHHTNVVAIHARGEHDGEHYYAMELIDGPSLDRYIRSRPDWFTSGFSRDEAFVPAPAAPAPYAVPAARPDDYRTLATRLAEVAEGLACAHDQRVVHRDVKPHNLLVGADGRLILTDFGLARLTEEPHLTECGEVLGTPSYRSPEQVRGRPADIDHRTDVYSLGVTMYEILTRRRPFTGETREQIAHAILHQPVTAPRRIDASIPVPLETICLRAMEREPARRYPTARALADDLRRFAVGARIRARRPGPLRRAARIARRRPAVATAMGAAIMIVALGAGWAWSAAAARRRDASHLLRDAYATLAFVDYRDADTVRDDIERAGALGADDDELDVAFALADAQREPERSVALLEGVVARRPDDLRARYMLAWTLWRTGARVESQAAFDEAEGVDATLAADGWLFRGLAAHFANPDEAIASYRRAIAVRADEGRFFPQAALHLARAHNQRMYATRSLDTFVEAESTLRQLADHGAYGAYPHYLLSIAHRLAAEIYSGSEGTRGRDIADGHFASALEWARRGQTLEPAYDRPITAEAECLESLGDAAAARDARTRAIQAADDYVTRWEGLHYRWRLHFWLGEYEPALADLAACAAFDPGNRFYEHVYPALVLHAEGRADDAAAQARAVAGDNGVEDVIWSATTLRLIGLGADADALLADRTASVDYAVDVDPARPAGWYEALYEHCRTGLGLARLEALADESPTAWTFWGEAHFHTAARHLAAGDRAAAQAGFRQAYRCFDNERRYTYHGKLMWRHLLRHQDQEPGEKE